MGALQGWADAGDAGKRTDKVPREGGSHRDHGAGGWRGGGIFLRKVAEREEQVSSTKFRGTA